MNCVLAVDVLCGKRAMCFFVFMCPPSVSLIIPVAVEQLDDEPKQLPSGETCTTTVWLVKYKYCHDDSLREDEFDATDASKMKKGVYCLQPPTVPFVIVTMRRITSVSAVGGTAEAATAAAAAAATPAPNEVSAVHAWHLATAHWACCAFLTACSQEVFVSPVREAIDAVFMTPKRVLAVLSNGPSAMDSCTVTIVNAENNNTVTTLPTFACVFSVHKSPLRCPDDGSTQSKVPVFLYSVAESPQSPHIALIYSQSASQVDVPSMPQDRRTQLVLPSQLSAGGPCLVLQSLERVCAVVWQKVDTPVAPVLSDSTIESSPLLAVLTNQRLLILSPSLTVLAQRPSFVPVQMPRPVASTESVLTSAELDARGFLHRAAITGIAWAASSLLYCSSTGAVSYLTPGNRSGRVCSTDDRVWNASIAGALPDRLVLTSSNWINDRVQVLTRSFCPLEVLVCGVLDHAQVKCQGSSFGHSSGAPSILMRTQSLQDAVAADLAYVCAVVLRYAHPNRVGGGGVSVAYGLDDGYSSDAGVTRHVIQALWDAGLGFAAYYVAQGQSEFKDAGTLAKRVSASVPNASNSAGQGGGGGSDADSHGGGEGEHGDDDAVDATALVGLNDIGFRRREHVAPWWWRSEMAALLGGFKQAVWSLLGTLASVLSHASYRMIATACVPWCVCSTGEHPHFASAVLEAVHGGHDVASNLPHPSSPLSKRLLLLGRLCAVYSQLATAALCFDLAGAAQELLTLVRVTLLFLANAFTGCDLCCAVLCCAALCCVVLCVLPCRSAGRNQR